MGSERSTAARSETKDVVSGFIRHVGMTKTGQSVYFIFGLGYWIAPAKFGIYPTLNGKAFITYRNTHVKKYGTIKENTTECALETLTNVVTAVFRQTPIYSHLYRQPWVDDHQPNPIVRISNDGRARAATLHAPVSLQDVYSEVIYIANFPAHGPIPKKVYDKTHAKKQEMINLFKERYSMTLEEALTFHKTNPAVIVEE